MKRRFHLSNVPRFRGGLQFESLEDRHLLAADVFSSPEVGISFVDNPVSTESVFQRAASSSFVPGELLVALQIETIDPTIHTVLQQPWQAYLGNDGVSIAKTLIDLPGPHGSYQLVQANLPKESDPLAAVKALTASHQVLWSQPNFIYEGEDPREFTPNDPLFANQYHHGLIGSEIAWDVTLGASDIVIGITDDGVDIQHDDLSAAIWTNPGEIAGDGIDNDGNGYIDDVHGYNFLDGNNDVDADPGDIHGTHIAGIAAAVANNGTGTAGVAGGATIMPLKWFDGGIWTAAMIAETFTYAADNGVDIISTSYNMDFWADDPIVQSAFEYLYDAGVLHFNSAGNGNDLNPPRQVFEESLLVANTDVNDIRSPSSNYGSGIDLAAPGVSIFSTVPGNGYGFRSGTSMAAPNAAATAALIWSANPDWTREQVVAQLLSTTDNVDAENPSFTDLLGKGRINSGRSLTESLAAPQVASVTNLPSSGSAKGSEAIQKFHIKFNQFMDGNTVIDPAAYRLLEAGADELFGTADDQVHPLSISNDYLVGTNGIDVEVTNGSLGIGSYRFSIDGSLVMNPFGDTLDGNADGVGGDNFEVDFAIEIEAFQNLGVVAGLHSASEGNVETIVDSGSHKFFVAENESVSVIATPSNPQAVFTAELEGISAAVTADAPGEPVLIPLTSVSSSGIVDLDITSTVQSEYTFDIYRNVNVLDLVDPSASPIDISDSAMPIGLGNATRFAATGITNPTEPDVYQLPLTEGASVDIQLEGIDASISSATVELFDPTGMLVATAVPTASIPNGQNPEQVISGLIATSPGTHTIRVQLPQVVQYSLVVTEDAIYDLEPNDSITTARPVDGVSSALGYLELHSMTHDQYNDPAAFVDISTTGTALSIADEGITTISTTVGNILLPTGTVSVGNNGGLIAGQDISLGRINTNLPAPDWNEALLPFWDDLSATTGDVYWEETVVGGIDTLIVQWQERPHFSSGGDVTFQVQLFDSGPVAARFAYQDVLFGNSNDFGSGATIGVQLSPTNSHEISFNTATLADGDVIDIQIIENDYYSFTLAADEEALFQTSTPFDASLNQLDPRLTIVDGNGDVLTSDTNSSADGKNSTLSFRPTTPGTYYVAVGLENGFGTYVLDFETEIVIDGDFNNDGLFDCFDLNALGAEVANASNDLAFDLTGDGVVDLLDRDTWLADAAPHHGLAFAFLEGDINLDGTVDGGDFLVWNANKFTQTSAYCAGDIDMNGMIDGGDFLLWNATKFTSSAVPVAAAVLPANNQSAAADHISISDAVTAPPPTPERLPTSQSTTVDSAFASYDSTRSKQDVSEEETPHSLATHWNWL